VAIVSHKHRIVFFPLAKNCSTSLKYFFYELDTGRPFRRVKARFNLPGHIHTYFPTATEEKWLKFYNAYDTMAVVRDPISRFLSAYGNRIVHARALETRGNVVETLKAKGLSTIPDLPSFIDNLEAYVQISSYTKNHISPQSSVIGGIFKHIKHIYPLSKVSEIPSFVLETRGVEIALPHEQSTGPKFKQSDLSAQHLAKLIDFYSEDYAMLKDYFQPPALPVQS
jgi:hypothetical protein